MSALITKQPLLLLTYQPKQREAPKEVEEISPKDLALAQRNIEIAKQRGLTMAEVLSYDLLQQSPLFKGDYLTEPTKAVLVSEVEEMIPSIEKSVWNRDSAYSTHVVLDFMSKVRQSKMNKSLTLGGLCE